MALFDPRSRYVKFAHVYTTTDRRGRTVMAVGPASLPHESSLGVHRRKQGERLDHLAAFYLRDATGFWRITAHNGVMLPEALSDAPRVDIPAGP